MFLLLGREVPIALVGHVTQPTRPCDAVQRSPGRPGFRPGLWRPPAPTRVRVRPLGGNHRIGLVSSGFVGKVAEERGFEPTPGGLKRPYRRSSARNRPLWAQAGPRSKSKRRAASSPGFLAGQPPPESEARAFAEAFRACRLAEYEVADPGLSVAPSAPPRAAPATSRD